MKVQYNTEKHFEMCVLQRRLVGMASRQDVKYFTGYLRVLLIIRCTTWPCGTTTKYIKELQMYEQSWSIKIFDQ